MNTPPIDADLALGLRAAAAGTYAAEAAVELLIRHQAWLTRSTFVHECLEPDDAGEFIGISWARVAQHVNRVDAQPSDRAIALIAAQLGGYPDPGESGEWRVTPTSPRLRPGPLHPWPAALPSA